MMAANEKNFSKQENNSGFTEGENLNIIIVLQAENNIVKGVIDKTVEVKLNGIDEKNTDFS